jgi:hypothetical protein
LALPDIAIPGNFVSLLPDRDGISRLGVNLAVPSQQRWLQQFTPICLASPVEFNHYCACRPMLPFGWPAEDTVEQIQ